MTTVEFLRLLRITDDNTENRDKGGYVFASSNTNRRKHGAFWKCDRLSGNRRINGHIVVLHHVCFSPDNFLSLLNISVSEEIYVLDRLSRWFLLYQIITMKYWKF